MSEPAGLRPQGEDGGRLMHWLVVVYLMSRDG